MQNNLLPTEGGLREEEQISVKRGKKVAQKKPLSCIQYLWDQECQIGLRAKENSTNKLAIYFAIIHFSDLLTIFFACKQESSLVNLPPDDHPIDSDPSLHLSDKENRKSLVTICLLYRFDFNINQISLILILGVHLSVMVALLCVGWALSSEE